jgi:hypothetical protein
MWIDRYKNRGGTIQEKYPVRNEPAKGIHNQRERREGEMLYE